MSKASLLGKTRRFQNYWNNPSRTYATENRKISSEKHAAIHGSLKFFKCPQIKQKKVGPSTYEPVKAENILRIEMLHTLELQTQIDE